MKNPTMLQAALALSTQGLPVFPCNPLDKRPFTKHGFKDATKDIKQITKWWTTWPNAMIGMPMGKRSGMFCVDLDLKDDENGIATWEAWSQEWNVASLTREHSTPSGGKHLLFQWQPDIRNIPLHKLGTGVEIKGDGGYICVPPGHRADGKEYKIINECVPSPAPQQLLDKMFAYYRGERADDSVGANANEKLDPEIEKLIEQDIGKGITPEPPPDIELIKAALDAIPSDDYDIWFKIAGALRRELGDSGYALFEAWSGKSKKFDAKQCQRKWEDAKDIHQISAGTIFHYADEADPTWRERYEQRKQKEQEQEGPQFSAKLADVLKNAATLQTKTFEPLRWTVLNYLLEGLNLLGGRPKIGKSWWALDVAVAIASDDGTCMGEECEHGDVLALMLEDTDRRLQRRLTKMLGAQKEAWPKRLTYAISWPRLDVGGIAWIKEWLGTVANPRLIIIDILERVLPRLSNKDKRSQYSTDYYALAMLQELTKAHPGLCIVVLHHQRKAGAEDLIDTISGTLGVAAAVDAVLILGKDGVSENKFLYGRGRDLEEFNVIIKQDEHARWQVLGPKTEEGSSIERTKILAVLARTGRPMTIREIAEELGFKHANVKYLLFKLHEEGQVEKAGTGLYCLPKPPQNEMPF